MKDFKDESNSFKSDFDDRALISSISLLSKFDHSLIADCHVNFGAYNSLRMEKKWTVHLWIVLIKSILR